METLLKLHNGQVQYANNTSCNFLKTYHLTSTEVPRPTNHILHRKGNMLVLYGAQQKSNHHLFI